MFSLLKLVQNQSAVSTAASRFSANCSKRGKIHFACSNFLEENPGNSVDLQKLDYRDRSAPFVDL